MGMSNFSKSEEVHLESVPKRRVTIVIEAGINFNAL